MNEPKHSEVNTEMGNYPFFSIIMPVYNAASFLRECLDSVISQGFHDWEAILVDDVSTDDSLAIAEEYAHTDARIRIFTTFRNSGGAYVPRMMAANLAKGKYLVAIDADDMVESDYLQIIYDRIWSTNADIVLTEMWRLKDGNSSRILPDKSVDSYRVWRGKELIELTLCEWRISMNGFAIKRDIYVKADANVSDLDKKSLFADELLSRWLLFLSPNAAICNAVYFYRLNEGSVTRINIPRFIESKLLTSDGLIAMTSKSFGDHSPHHIDAIDTKFRSVIGLLRLINSSNLPKQKKDAAIQNISASMKGFDFACLKGRMSPRYLALFRLPIPLVRIALKILDPIMNIKNGI